MRKVLILGGNRWLGARVAARCGLGKRFAEWCFDVGPTGSRAAAQRLLAQARKEALAQAREGAQ